MHRPSAFHTIAMIAAIVAALAATAPGAAAQGMVSIGISAPLADAATRRLPGPSLAVASEHALSDRWGFRPELSARGLPGKTSALPHVGQFETLVAVTVSGSMVFRPAGARGPYLLAGLGVHWLELVPDRGSTSHRPVPGGHVGGGFRTSVAGLETFAGIRGVLTLSDRGNDDFAPVSWFEIRFGFVLEDR